MSSGLIAIGSVPPGLLLQVIAAFALVAVVLLALAPVLSDSLLRSRARRLPLQLGERLLEEWLAEVHAIEHRFAKLTYALALALASTKSLAPEADDTTLTPVAIAMDFADLKIPTDFSIRLWAVILDQAVVYAALTMPSRWARGHIGSWVSNFMAILWFAAMEVYFVQRFNGSPGKLLAKLRIVTMDGSPLTYKHAFLRVATPLFLILILTLIFRATIPSTMTMAEFGALPRAAQLALIPRSISWLSLLLPAWAFADFISFFAGYDRRPLHDRIAGTMVVHKIPAVPGPPYKLERPVW